MTDLPSPVAGPRLPVVLALTVVLSLLVWFTTPAREQVEVMGLTWRMAWDFPERSKAMLLVPGTGQFVLPQEARAIVRLVREHGITRYDLSPELRRIDFVYQRIIESSWPSRCEAKAPHVFMTAAEAAAYLPPTVKRMEADGIVVVRRY